MTVDELAAIGRQVRDEARVSTIPGDQRQLYLLREQLRTAIAAAPREVLLELSNYAPAGEAPAYARLELARRGNEGRS